MAQLSEYTEITQVLNEQNRNTEITNKILMQVTGFLREQLGFLRKEEYEALDTKAKEREKELQGVTLQKSDFKVAGLIPLGLLYAAAMGTAGAAYGVAETALRTVMLGFRAYFSSRVFKIFVDNKITRGITRLTTIIATTVTRITDSIINLFNPNNWGRVKIGGRFYRMSSLGAGGTILGNTIRLNLIKPIEGILNIFKSFGQSSGPFARLTKTAFALGRVIGRLFLPITAVISLFDAFRGAMKNLEELGEGASIFEKVYAGLTGIVEGFIGGIGDAVFGVLSWITGKFRLNNLSKFLGEIKIGELIGDVFSGIKGIFSMIFGSEEEKKKGKEDFKKMFGSLFDLLTIPINSAVNFIKDIFSWNEEGATPFSLKDFVMSSIKKVLNVFNAIGAGLAAAVKALVPGGDNPFEAFEKAYQEAIGTPGIDKVASARIAGGGGFGNIEEYVAGQYGVYGLSQPGIIDGSISNSGNTNNTTAINLDGTPYDPYSFREISAIQDKWRGY